jgi:hypothetical protein
MLTAIEERLLVGFGLAADRSRLERVARVVLDRNDAVTDLLRAAGRLGDDGRAAWQQIRDVLDSRNGARAGLNLLDLVVEIGQQERESRGEPRTWEWPGAATRRDDL